MAAFRFLTAGESHGPTLGVTIEGVPAGLALTADGLAVDLARRQKGYGRGARQAIEQDRAEIVADNAGDVESLVRIGSWVTYRMNWGVPRKTVRLVWPEDLPSDLAGVSVLSALGAALIGLRVGDHMPYVVAGCLNLVRIEHVERSEPVERSKSNVVPLFRARSAGQATTPDDDPGPTAA